MERLRIMRIIARMNVGGPAVQVSELVAGLDKDRFEQRLYTGAIEDDEADFTRLRAGDVRGCPVRTLGRSIRPTDDVRAFADLVAAMRSFRPHIVHTHTAKAGAVGRVAAIVAGVPVRVHTFHGHLLRGYFSPARTRLVIETERLLARRTDRLIAVGSRVRDDLIAARIGRAGQYVVVPPGLRLPQAPPRAAARQQLGLAAQAPVVAYVGRVTGIKRPDRLLDVAASVRLEVPAVRFLVCGEGDLLDETMLRAHHAGLGDTVTFLPWRADVQTVYAAADLVLLTSDNEGMPLSLIEAALCGRPAVATSVGSVAEVLGDGETGLLCGADTAELSRNVVRLLRDRDLRDRMGHTAHTRAVTRFGADRLVSDVSRIYGEIAAARGWWPEPRPATRRRRVAGCSPTTQVDIMTIQKGPK